MKLTRTLQITLLCAALLFAVMMLFSCGDAAGADTTGDTTAPPEINTTEDEGTTGAEGGETAPTGPMLSFTENGELKFRIVRSQAPSEEEFNAANDFRAYLSGLLGASADVSVVTDDLHVGEVHDPDTYEILIGLTNYEETKTALERVEYGECTVSLVGRKIVVAGWDGVSTEKGLLKLRSLLRELSENGDPKNLSIPVSSLNFTLKGNKRIEGVPRIEYGTFRTVYDCGTNVYELIASDVEDGDFDGYLEVLEAAGYTKYADNERGKVRFATYVNDQHILNVYHQAAYKDLRVIVEEYDEKLLPPKKAEYEKICETEFAQVGLEYSGNQIGHCFIWKLEDGRFIIVDGGLDPTLVYQALFTMAENPREIVIASWILSHFHHDHTDAFEDFGAKYGTFVTLETVIWNSPSAAQYDYEGSNCDMSGYMEALTSISKFKVRPTVYKAHPGQVYHFSNARIEVLYTLEMYAPANIGKSDLNTTSLVLDVSFGAFNMNITNDMTEKANLILSNNYGNTLQADVGQVAHHGYAGGTTSYYELIAPTYGLFTTGGEHYKACKYDSRNTYFTSSHNGLREVFVAKDDIYVFTLKKDEGFTDGRMYENITDFVNGIEGDY